MLLMNSFAILLKTIIKMLNSFAICWTVQLFWRNVDKKKRFVEKLWRIVEKFWTIFEIYLKCLKQLTIVQRRLQNGVVGTGSCSTAFKNCLLQCFFYSVTDLSRISELSQICNLIVSKTRNQNDPNLAIALSCDRNVLHP